MKVPLLIWVGFRKTLLQWKDVQLIVEVLSTTIIHDIVWLCHILSLSNSFALSFSENCGKYLHLSTQDPQNSPPCLPNHLQPWQWKPSQIHWPCLLRANTPILKTWTCDFLNGSIHPGKLTWNHVNGGLEDDCPLQLGDFKVPCQRPYIKPPVSWCAIGKEGLIIQ